MNGAGLQGIRVLEFAGGVGLAYLAKLFGDLGADVIRVENDGDDRVRERPHDIHRWLNANKRSVTREHEELTGGADIVLHDRRPAAAKARGLTYAELSAGAPRLVVCSFTPWGMSGPYADYAAEEITTIHASSWGFLSPSSATDPELPPLKAPGHHSTLMVANIAAAATLAAFDRAERTGVGDHVDFSVFAASAKITEGAPAGASFVGAESSRLGVKTVVPWGTYSCLDGMVQLICPEQKQWESLVKLMGTPEWSQLGVFDDNDMRRDNSDLVEMYLAEWLAARTVGDVYRDAQAQRICLSPVNTMSQLAADAHFEARGFFAETPDGLRVPGPGYQIDQPWWGLRSSAPSAGEHDGQSWLDREDPPEPVEVPDQPVRPLDGIRVCDFTWVWAGPMCTQVLAHLGADVIRLESHEYLCLFRRLPFNPPEFPLEPDSNGLFQTYNSDKKSLGVDLSSPGAKEVIRRLIERSDVVVDNFAVGTMAALGFSVDDIRVINPDAIVVSLSGYGQTGPSAGYMAYGPAGGAVSGLYAANGYAGGPPFETGIAIGDPGTGITAAWATVAALVARRRDGAAARVDVAMVEAVAATVGELWMEYIATGRDPQPHGNRDHAWAPHAAYPADGDDEWVTIACTDEESWRALCDVVDPALAEDPRFGSADSRLAHEPELDAIVGAWTSTLEGWEVARRLQAVGVASFPSMPALDLWGGDPQLADLGMLERPAHPVTGAHVVPGIPWRLARGANGIEGPAPCLGQHSRDVVVDLLGFTAAEFDAFVEAGAVHEGPVAPD